MTIANDNTAITGLAAAPTQVLFIDARVPDQAALIAAADPGTQVIVLDAHHNGIEQIAAALAQLQGVRSVGVVAHGDAGMLLLGNAPLFSGNLDQHDAALQTIGRAMGAGADLQLYGCDVGAGDAGAEFLNQLASRTGVDVTASSNATGSAARGGDWTLEVATGTIESAPVLHAQDLSGYDFMLHTASVSTLAQLKAAITTAQNDGSDDVITLTGNIASSSGVITVNVTDGKTLSIVGGGFALSANNVSRVLSVQGGHVTIDNLTINNGLVSGAGGDTSGTAAGSAGG